VFGINPYVKKCSSQKTRCGRLACTNCAWHSAGRVARRILSSNPRHLHAVEIEVPISTLADFWTWRVQARNIVDYSRRACQWWRDVSLCVWLCEDGRIRGLVSLGSIAPEEFLGAVGRRWPTTLRAIDPTKVREEIYGVIRPGQIANLGLSRGRYQPLKFQVGPRRRSKSLFEWACVRDSYLIPQ
jgi:hypothetical protein